MISYVSEPLKNIDLVSLRVFLAVVDTESIRAASENLSLSISAVSRRIADLEVEFGQQLFTRHSRGVEVTEAGRLLGARARDTLSTLRHMHSDMVRLKLGKAGRVRLGANGSALVNGLAEDIGQFLETHPGIEFDLLEQMTPEILDQVAQGTLDIGFHANTMRIPEGVKTLPYLEDRLVLTVPNGHTLAALKQVRFAQMLEFQMIGVSETSSLTRLMRKVGGLSNANFAFSYMASTNEVARTMVASKLGVAVLPAKFVERYTDLLPISAIPIAEDWANREITIAVRAEQDFGGSSQVFFDWIVDRRGSFRPA